MRTLQLPGTPSTTLRRHSISEPSLASPSLLLDTCLRRTASLHEKLDQLTEQVRERSRSTIAVTADNIESEDSVKVADMVCHGCHGEIGSGAHIGSATGKNLCKFNHSSFCHGGILDDDAWRACPDDYVFAGQRVSPHTSEMDLSRFQR